MFYTLDDAEVWPSAVNENSLNETVSIPFNGFDFEN